MKRGLVIPQNLFLIMVIRFKILKALFILLIITFCIILIFHSIDTIDGGFILSFVGRLHENQIPYKDFDIVRPPGSIFLWKTLLPYYIFNSSYLIIVSRLVFLLGIGIIGIISERIIFNNRQNWVIVSFFTITVVHSFNIMPWHTVDGILFGLFSIYFIKKKLFIASIIFAILACFTKQSYYLFLVFIFLLNFYQFINSKRTLLKKDLLISFILLFVIFYYIFKYDIIQNLNLFFEQTKTENGLNQLFDTGFKSYFFDNYKLNLIFLILILALFFCRNIVKKNYLFVIITGLFFCNYFIGIFQNGNYLYTNQLFVLFFIIHLIYHRKDYYGYSLFFLAWCSSISWGYNQPIFLIGILYYYLFKDNITEKMSLYFAIILIIIFSLIRIKFPYFNKSMMDVEYTICNDVPIISGIYMPKETYLYYKEILNLSKKNKNVIFLPGTPLADVICKCYNNRAPWEMNVEYPNFHLDKKLLLENKFTFIIDKEPVISIEGGFFKSDFTKFVKENTFIIDSTHFFNIHKR